MSRFSITLSTLLATVGVAVAQSPQTPSEGVDLHRTRLIPYATDAAAADRQLSKQRYMQPIVEWTRDAEGALLGEFTYPFSWVERQVFLRVEGAGQPYEVWVNGKRAGASNNGFADAEYNITKLAREDKNSVMLRLLPTESVAAIECFAHSAAQPRVYVLSQPRVRVRDIYYRTSLGVGKTVNVDFGVVMHNQTLGQKTSRIYYELMLNDTVRLSGGHRDVVLGMHGVDTMRFGAPMADTLLWTRERNPRIDLHLKNRIAGRDVEFYVVPVMLRDVQYRDGEFEVNGGVESLVWCDMEATATLADVESKVRGGVRAIRFKAGYVCDDILDYCDEQGLFVALTAPINSSKSGMSRRRGGNPSNNPRWVADYVERGVQMVHNTKRHPSVVAYYLADNSANGIALYECYLAMKAVAGRRPVFYTDGGNEWNSDLKR